MLSPGFIGFIGFLDLSVTFGVEIFFGSTFLIFSSVVFLTISSEDNLLKTGLESEVGGSIFISLLLSFGSGEGGDGSIV
ncbi:hypothetical protein H9X57_18200 [Flavobacterium piscinae]|uniref:hypothetical protein n=1 Tax=Flavobacterium piscinae TaxID=2506424 RepID=UPI0019C5BB11|nr:hypothetical protein [Flavobacterium piscinae]MBC8884607.1 hypothetical protein [Flavobacterium piscinae]